MQAKDALYAQAEAVYRRYIAEELRISRLGGTDELTPELAATTMGLFQQASVENALALKSAGITITGGDFVIVSISRRPGLRDFDSVVTLAACVDGSSTDTYVDGAFSRHNAAVTGVYYFAWDGNVLKIAGGNDSQVAACEG